MIPIELDQLKLRRPNYPDNCLILDIADNVRDKVTTNFFCFVIVIIVITKLPGQLSHPRYIADNVKDKVAIKVIIFYNLIFVISFLIHVDRKYIFSRV